MICNKCGHENVENAIYCTNCGAALTAAEEPETVAAPVQDAGAPMYTAPQPQYTPPQPQYTPPQPQYTPPQNAYNPVNPVIPPEYKPLGAWAYFGWQLLFSIPLVGFILLIVFACGGGSNVNLRNFARSYFCGLLIVAILVIVIVILMVVFGVSAASFYNAGF